MLNFIISPGPSLNPLDTTALIKPYFGNLGALKEKHSSGTVEKLVKRMIDASQTASHGDHLSTIKVLPGDFASGHGKSLEKDADPAFMSACAKKGTYVHAESETKNPYMQFCESAFAAPDFSQVKCPKDKMVSYKLFSLASVAIQAMVYTELVWENMYVHLSQSDVWAYW